MRGRAGRGLAPPRGTSSGGSIGSDHADGRGGARGRLRAPARRRAAQAVAVARGPDVARALGRGVRRRARGRRRHRGDAAPTSCRDGREHPGRAGTASSARSSPAAPTGPARPGSAIDLLSQSRRAHAPRRRPARRGGEPDCNVLFHDAARPLVDQRIIADCVAALAQWQAIGVVVPSADTIVEVTGGTLGRSCRASRWPGARPRRASGCRSSAGPTSWRRLTRTSATRPMTAAWCAATCRRCRSAP